MPLQLSVEERAFHFHKPAVTSRGALAERRVWLLRLSDHSDPHRVGSGECGPIPGLSLDDTPAFGNSAREVANRFNTLHLHAGDSLAWFETTRLFDGLPSLRFGFETALLDWMGGGRGLLWPSAFACDGAPLRTHGLIWMDSPAGMAAQAKAKLDAGFGVLKLKIGALPRDAERALLGEIAAMRPGVTLRLDANGAFDATSALAYLADLEGLPVEFCEQPLRPGQRDVLGRVCAESPVPIVLDEELIGVDTPTARRQLFADVWPHGVILKPALLGGFAACDDWIAASHEAGVAWWANSLLETAIGHSAICQWVAARDGARIHGLGSGSLFADNLPSPIHLVGPALVSETRCPHVH